MRPFQSEGTFWDKSSTPPSLQKTVTSVASSRRPRKRRPRSSTHNFVRASQTPGVATTLSLWHAPLASHTLLHAIPQGSWLAVARFTKNRAGTPWDWRLNRRMICPAVQAGSNPRPERQLLAQETMPLRSRSPCRPSC